MLNNPRKDIPLIVTSLLCIILIALAFSLFPQQSSQMAETIFSGVTRLLGSTIQILVLLGLILVLYIAVSKYGNIRLGEGKPEYRTIPWLFMFICAGLGSSTLYWGVMEWAYYYQTPGLNIAPKTPKALEYSVSYSFFHWDQCVGNLCVGLADYGLPFSCQKKQRVKFIGDYLGHYRGQPAGFLGASGRSDLFNRDNRGADDLISDHRRHIYWWTDCAYRRA